MRYVLMAAALILFGAGALVFFNWETIARTYEEGKQAVLQEAYETATTIGQGAYHAEQCGHDELRAELEGYMDELGEMSATIKTAAQDAFAAGLAEAEAMDLDYTKELCAKVAEALDN